MDNGLDFFNNWAKTQKEFLDTSLKSQEVFRLNWLESIKKTQDSFLSIANGYDNPQGKELAKLFNTWFNTVISSSEAFNDQALKSQQSWQKALETQIEQSQELVKTFSEYLKQAQPADKHKQ
jgi:hypothetical protein